jgi:hypothetical protein
MVVGNWISGSLYYLHSTLSDRISEYGGQTVENIETPNPTELAYRSILNNNESGSIISSLGMH